MRYLNSADYIPVNGSRAERRLKVFALSTCAFCKKAIRFLEDNDFQFEYLYLDQIDRETKKEIKTELRGKFGSVHLFPLLLIDDATLVTGFTESEWREHLNFE